MPLASTKSSPAAPKAAAWTSLTYVLWFFGLGIYVPYFPLWLEARGFDDATIGILLAVPMVVRIVTIAPITQLGDGPIGTRRIFLILSSGAACAYLGLVFVESFGPVALMLAVISAFVASGVPVLDVLVLNGVTKHSFDYGRIRFWGSTSWLAANLAGGGLLGLLPPEVIPPLLAILAALSALTGLALPRDGGRHPTTASTDGRGPSLRLFLILAAGLACIHGGHAFLLGFSTLMWQRMGYSAVEIGILWSIGIVIEMGFFRWAGGLARRTGPMPLILIGALAGAIRWSLMALEPTSPIIISLLQCTHAITYAGVHLATMNWLGAHSAGRARRSGWLATLISAAMAGSTILSGQLFALYGAAGFIAMSGLSLAGLVLCAVAWSIERREAQG